MKTGYQSNMYKFLSWNTGGRSNAVPVQPEVAKEKGGRPEAASSKPQATSGKRLKKDIIKKYS